MKGMRVVVVGMGRSGRAAADLALSRGATVVGLDTRADAVHPGVEVTSAPWEEVAVGADLVIVSPGVAAAHPAIQAAQAAGVEVVGELGFAARFISGPIIGITGTNGKSTVTTFVGKLSASPGRRVFVGGNLGTPLSAAVGQGPFDLYVVEISSYQLELPGTLRVQVAVVLNLTPDHLARHGTMEAYGRAKAEIVAGQRSGDVALLPHGHALLTEAAKGLGEGERLILGALPGVSRDGRVATVRSAEREVRFDLSDVTVPGAHNLDHAATAAALAWLAGGDPAEIQSRLGSLRALEHRMEPVHEADGLLWIDDSKATNLASTSVGISGLDRPAVVLLGGKAKGPGFRVLAPDLRQHRAVVAFGGSGPDIARELRSEGLQVSLVPTMAEAVERARDLAQPGDAILLSPAAASFDEFNDFAHRGRVFAALARGGSR